MEKAYPYNLLEDIGAEVEELAEDFPQTLLYVLQSVTDKRNSKVLLMRYRDGKTFEEIGEEFGITRQRANVIVSQVIEDLKRDSNKRMIERGIKNYMEETIRMRIDELSPILAIDERKRLTKEAYEKGYENGQKDALTGRTDNKADMEAVRKIRVKTLTFSVRAINSFERNSIETLGDIIDKGDTLKDMRGFGKISFQEVVKFLEQYSVDTKSIYPRTYLKFDMPI